MNVNQMNSLQKGMRAIDRELVRISQAETLKEVIDEFDTLEILVIQVRRDITNESSSTS